MGRYRQALAENKREGNHLGINPTAWGNENRNTVCCWIDSCLLSREGQEKGEKQTAVSFPWEGDNLYFLNQCRERKRSRKGSCDIKEFKQVKCSRLVLIVVVVLDLAGIFMDSPAAAYTQFGFNLFQKLNKIHDGNIFFSPVGISTAIGMLALEARGATAVQLQKVRSLLLLSSMGSSLGAALQHYPEMGPGNRECI